MDPEDHELIKRRLVAARALRGLDQDELGAMVAADGMGKHDIGRVERGTLAFGRALRESAAKHLGVPLDWFTEDLEVLLRRFQQPEGIAEIHERLDRLERALEARLPERRLGEIAADLKRRADAEPAPNAAALHQAVDLVQRVAEAQRGDGSERRENRRQRPDA